jgi:GNAT superfamily N-acetyltransferase
VTAFPRIRLADRDDVLAAIPVINAAFAVETFLDGTRTDEQRITAMMNTGEFLVAEDDRGRIIASVYVEHEGERGYFGMLAVDPAVQRAGLGRRMVEAAEEHCRQLGCKHMDIAVLSLRHELPPFYRKLGYVETGTEQFHPSRPLRPGVECHCIIMSKPLAPS